MSGVKPAIRRADPVLALHRVASRVYELSGLRTGSVRDQALRAALVVERLSAAHLQGLGGTSPIINRSNPLLVIGGGAAGVTAALRASEVGVEVLLLEASLAVMATQLGIRTRTIDPAEYDWPHAHWSRGAFPPHPGERDLPISIDRQPAGDLATLWQLQLNAWTKGITPASGKLEVRHRTRVVGLADGTYRFQENVSKDPEHPLWEPRGLIHWDNGGVYMTHDDTGHVVRFGAVISCVGFGVEGVEVPDLRGGSYAGPYFWGNDKLCERHLGLPRNAANESARVDVLVSGGGDGAQQDVQRVLTKRSGRELFDAFADVDSDFANRIPAGNLALADDEGRRAHAWARTDERDAAISSLKRWHAAYATAVDQIWQGWSESQHSELLSRVIRDQDRVHLTWLLSSPVPTFSYGLNRLLTLLVLRLHELATKRPYWCADIGQVNGDKPIVITGARLECVEVVGAGVFSAYVSSTQGAHTSISPHVHLGDFDIVVIRHGIEPAPLFGSPPISEQIMPFGFPG